MLNSKVFERSVCGKLLNVVRVQLFLIENPRLHIWSPGAFSEGNADVRVEYEKEGVMIVMHLTN